MSALALMFFGSKRQDISRNLQELFSDKIPISIYDAYDNKHYIITPYKDVKILTNVTTKLHVDTWAQYNATLFKSGLTIMVFATNKCAGLSKLFYLNIMCNPFYLRTYYPIDFIDECTYSLDFYTSAACISGASNWHSEL